MQRVTALSSQLSSLGPSPASIPQSGREDLTEERSNTSFNIRQLTYFLDGGPEKTAFKEKVMLEFERDPSFRLDDINDLTRPQLRERYMTRLRSMVKYITSESIPDFQTRLNILVIVDPGFLTRIGVHYGLFLNTVMNQGTPEQVSYWVSRGAVNLNGVIGCFGMTELGHGSNVAGVETIAVYDSASDEFVLHTPTLTATKWWIGGAAESATHCVVFARMIVSGKDYGPQPFVCQLRNYQDFSTLPGVTIGDCGAKMGRNGIDNGWIQFTHVRIPRSYLLMRYTKVTRDAKVEQSPLAQLSFGALVYARTMMIKENGDFAKKALVIALRYACIRRQFSSEKDMAETKLIDYRTHQHRLIPLLATSFAMHFTAMEAYRIYGELIEVLNVAKPGDSNMREALEALKECHGTSAGVKAHTGYHVLVIISIDGKLQRSLISADKLVVDTVIPLMPDWHHYTKILLFRTAGKYIIHVDMI